MAKTTAAITGSRGSISGKADAGRRLPCRRLRSVRKTFFSEMAIIRPHVRREITSMKPLLTLAFGLLLTVTAAAQQKSSPPAKAPAAASSAQTVLEAKIRKAWEDYKNRNKEAFAAILADDFGEVTNDADAIAGKDEEVSEMDRFHLTTYDLSDFKLRPVGNAG